LRDAISRFAPRLELNFQFLAVQGFDVRRHADRLTEAGEETKFA
jgi:hypothetical protein